MFRFLGVVVLICSFLAVGTRPVQARYEWCSVDPVLSFKRNGNATSKALDVQVMVPLWALPLADTATLSVAVPSNVAGQEILNTSTALFTLETAFNAVKPQANSDRYEVDLVLLVPHTAGDIPVQMVVTDPNTGTVSIFEGLAGHKVRATVEVQP